VNARAKIVGLKKLKNIVRALKKKGQRIAFTNGCFDLLHVGHTAYLERAKGKNRVLIVGLNSDSSVKKIKGPGRPIVNENERAAVLTALASVDYVTIFKEETPLKVIAVLKPDVLVKGADWKMKEVVGADVVKANGGKVEFIRYIQGSSTTNIIERIRATCGG